MTSWLRAERIARNVPLKENYDNIVEIEKKEDNGPRADRKLALKLADDANRASRARSNYFAAVLSITMKNSAGSSPRFLNSCSELAW